MKILTILFLLSVYTFSATAQTSPLAQGIQLYRQNDYAGAALRFHKATNSKGLSAEQVAQANYFLGLALYNLKLYQASSYPMIKVMRSDSKKYKQKAMEKLINISNRLGDQHILDYVMAKMQVTELEQLAVDVYYYKLGVVSYDKSAMDDAIKYLSQSIAKNPKNESALNLLGLIYLKKSEAKKAVEIYTKLLALYDNRANSNIKKGYTTLNLARAYYQDRNFEEAARFYRRISKDNSAYRESLTELGWTYLNLSRVRSALSAIQTLHTPFYENFFEPESLVLRAILLNYMCQFDEAEKAVKSFNENYESTLNFLNNWTGQTVTVAKAIAEINYATEVLKSESGESAANVNSYKGQIPFKITRSILKDSRMKNLYDTYIMVRDESRLAKKSLGTSKNSLSLFLDKIYTGRQNYYKSELAAKFSDVILSVEKNITYYNQQIKFVNYEILEAKKSQLRIKIGANSKSTINDEQNRNFYVKNGYRYWPFQGEFWLDEVGNYQYLGVNRCEQE